jgi:hypothetical protein
MVSDPPGSLENGGEPDPEEEGAQEGETSPPSPSPPGEESPSG